MSTYQYLESENVKKAREELEAFDKTKPKFNYNITGDALYRQYKDQATRQGQIATEDAIGRASAMTGGYGNSYAQTVGQQAYHEQLDSLNDKIPELYQLALSKYDQERQDWNNDRADAASRYDAAKESDISQYLNSLPSSPDQYLDALVDAGIMTEDEAYAFYKKSVSGETDSDNIVVEGEEAAPTPLQNMFNDSNDWNPTKDGWKVLKNGGINWGGGIDKNAEVLAPNGTTYTIHGLYNELVKELTANGFGESKAKKDAKELVIHLQEQLGI